MRIAQILAISLQLMHTMVSSQFHCISCSPLEVLTFTPKGPRFSDGPIFFLAHLLRRRHNLLVTAGPSSRNVRNVHTYFGRSTC
ncbi:hypothetical protein B5P45_12130 [Phyllobacterium zundukense]|uniref:Uncharacterized protein n=1 Tax=Phyllobacterium zundukense TaxID=1867719 RepID=A0A2N9VYN7_9HYPH|nr:hypothetical protein B5P45_12130 [Phyllobacterium zundukense]